MEVSFKLSGLGDFLVKNASAIATLGGLAITGYTAYQQMKLAREQAKGEQELKEKQLEYQKQLAEKQLQSQTTPTQNIAIILIPFLLVFLILIIVLVITRR